LTWLRRLRVKSEDPAVGRVCLVMLTDLIIRVGGKLVCQFLERIMLFGWCGLGGIWGFEGLDKGICWGFCGWDGDFYFGYELCGMRVERSAVGRGKGQCGDSSPSLRSGSE